jgi:DeoR/GlpR family transcriptional regulator of sugar metabolism
VGGGGDPARENILLDAGSTAGALAHELRGFGPLSLTTPGINTLQELADCEGIEVDGLGGRLRGVSQSFVRPWLRRRWSG